jgi:hypothetical protein
MNIAETIYQHVKTMPMAKAIEVLHFVEFLETRPDATADNTDENEIFEFMQSLPIGKRTDTEINKDFQAITCGSG